MAHPFRFDAPCLHTMVADKPMQGHRGMSNDEFGMTHWLHFENRTSAFALPSAIAVMHEKHGIACDMMHGFDWSDWSGRRVGGPGLQGVVRTPGRETRPTGCRPRALTRCRDRAGANAAHPRRTGTHPGTGRRQEAMGAGGVGIQRQRRVTCQPRATPWVCGVISSSPEGAAYPLSRPFRAWFVFVHRAQGVALGWPISPRWGFHNRALPGPQP